jgi:2,5-furandicarboxylate decarboxylase 1
VTSQSPIREDAPSAIGAEADLRSYLATLAGDPDGLIRVSRPVSGRGEMCAVIKALEPYGSPAIWFEHVEGARLPVVMGLFGTRRRIASALGVSVRTAVRHVLDLMASPLPSPVRATQAPVQEVIVSGEDVDLADLPLSVHSRADAGRYITAGVVAAKDPETGNINTGMYRMMVTGRQTVAVNAAPTHDLGRIFAAASVARQVVPIAITIGHHPAYAIASQLKNSMDIDAHSLAGGLLGGGLPVVPARTVALDVPARAEVVLEGHVDPADRVQEGPFGEFTYYYGAAKAPVCRITAITRRADAVMHDLHPTHPEHRCLWLFPGREARLYDGVRRTVPALAGVRIPFHCGALMGYLSIKSRRRGDGKQAIFAALATDHFLKHVVVVDDDIDIFDDQQVQWAMNTRFQADRDLISVSAAAGIRMDPSASRVDTPDGADLLTAKLGFDATVPPVLAFPERADFPVAGFENIQLDQYLGALQLERVASWAQWRDRAAE